ncbi:MAG: hypothetical protein HQL66_14725 [Magnetococcales bacterium]|nr:hypothetical protein [Magnetococcales bacterium]
MAAALFKSTDTSAPALSGSAGSLLALLDACLVNGYGSKSAAGWSKEFSGTNLAVYRPGAGTRRYLRIDDTGPGAGGAREARAFGYESMSDLNTGLFPFPTADQMGNGIFIRKSTSLDTTARAWWLLADNKRFYLFVDPADLTAQNCVTSFFFGDIFSLKTGGDDYCCGIIGRAVENNNSAAFDHFGWVSNYVPYTLNGHYLARTYTGLGTSIAIGKVIDSGKTGYSTGNNNFIAGAVGALTGPNPVDGGLYLSPLWINEPYVLRGRLLGVWAPCHVRPFNHQDTFAGAGDMSGKSFLVLNTWNGGQLILETSDTWS